MLITKILLARIKIFKVLFNQKINKTIKYIDISTLKFKKINKKNIILNSQ